MLGSPSALDYDPNSIFAASKKIRQVSLKNLEDSRKDEFTATKSNIVSAENLSNDINEYPLTIKTLNTSALQIGQYLVETERAIERDLEGDIIQKYNKKHTKEKDEILKFLKNKLNDGKINKEEYNKLVKETEDVYSELKPPDFDYSSVLANDLKLLSGGARVRTNQGARIRAKVANLKPRYHLRGGKKDPPGVFVDTSNLDPEPEDFEDTESTNSGEPVINFQDLENQRLELIETARDVYVKKIPILDLIVSLINSVNRANFFFNSRIKKFISKVSATDIEKLKSGTSEFFKTIGNLNFQTFIWVENGPELFDLLQSAVKKLFNDVNIAIKSTGGAGYYTGSGRYNPIVMDFQRFARTTPRKYLL